MPHSKKDLSLDDAGAPTSDIDARASGSAAPANDMGFDLGVTRESLDTYLARRSTKRLIRRVIRAHVAPKTPEARHRRHPTDPSENLKGEERWMITRGCASR